jgi:hypothetical protein
VCVCVCARDRGRKGGGGDRSLRKYPVTPDLLVSLYGMGRGEEGNKEGRRRLETTGARKRKVAKNGTQGNRTEDEPPRTATVV